MSKFRVLRNLSDFHWTTWGVFDESTRAAFESDFTLITPRHAHPNLDPDEIAGLITDVDAVLSGWSAIPMSAEMIESATDLKAIVHAAGSLRGVIAPLAWERGIVVCSMAPIIALAVAEMAVGLMFDGLLKVSRNDRMMRRDGGGQNRPLAVEYGRLQGAIVGIVGASATGRETIRLLNNLGVDVRVYDPFLDSDEAESLGVTTASLHEIFGQSDIVSLHAPLLPETAGMITGEHLALLREHTVLVNTARGEIMDHDALLTELETGRFHACLDVTDPEPLPPDSPFFALENVTLTPHTAGSTRVTYRMMGNQALRDMHAALEGGQPELAVSAELRDQLA